MEAPKLGPSREAIRERLARALGSAAGRVSTSRPRTGEGIGFVGRGEGVAALAIASARRGLGEGDARDPLHDTRSGELLPLRAARPRQGRHLRLRPDRVRPHPRRQRAAVRGLQPAQALPRARGLRGRRSSSTSPTSTTRSTPPPCAGRPSAELAAEMTERYFADTDALGLGRPDHEPLARATIAAIVEQIEPLIEHGHAYAAGRRRLLPRAPDPGYGVSVAPPARGDGPGRGRRGRRAQGGSARLRAVEGPQAGRGHRLGGALGARAARAGTSSARRWPRSARRRLRHPRRRLGPAVPPPRERGRADPRRPRARARADLDAQRHAPDRRREDVQVGRQHLAAARGARRATAATRSSCTVSRPLPPADRFASGALEQAPARVERIRDAARRLAAARPIARRIMRPLRERFFEALADDFNTPRALAAVFDWIREANRRGEGSGDGDLREMLGVLGLENLLLETTPTRRRRGRDSLAERESGARGTGLRARRRAARRDRGARLGGPRQRRRARADPAADSDRLRTQPRPRGAARPPRHAVSEVLGDSGRARASRGSQGARVQERRPPRRSSAAAARPRTRASARSSAVPLRPTARAAARPDAADRRARPGPGPAEPRRDLPHRRVRRRGRRRDPRAPRGRGHAGGLQGLGRRRRAPADRSRRATSPTSSIDAARRAAGATARAARGEGRPTTRRTTRRRRRARPRRRGPGPAAAGRGGCDALVALPLRGRIESLNVNAAAAALLYEVLQHRRLPLDKAP